jgi:hypothetical protein
LIHDKKDNMMVKTQRFVYLYEVIYVDIFDLTTSFLQGIF